MRGDCPDFRSIPSEKPRVASIKLRYWRWQSARDCTYPSSVTVSFAQSIHPRRWDYPREQRLRNVAGAFSARRGAFNHGGMLLLDDVATTGATLITCAQQLVHEGGAPWVWGAVLARGG